MTSPDSIPALFDRVAPGYDRMNRLLSLGLDPRWRARAVAELARAPIAGAARPRILDVATGTADFAIAAARRLPSAAVVGIDPSDGMLAIGRAKVAGAGLGARIELQAGDAAALPFPDASFDAVLCAFGIRNFPDVPKALLEFRRVLKPGGALLALEFFRPASRLLGALTSGWLAGTAPILAPSRRADYAYLRRSIGRTLSVQEFLSLATAVGLAPRSDTPAARLFLPCCSRILLARPNLQAVGRSGVK